MIGSTLTIESSVSTWSLQDSDLLYQLPPSQFSPEEQEWGFGLIDIKNKKIMFVEDDYHFTYLDTAMIEMSLGTLSNINTWYHTQKLNYLKRLDRLIALRYLGIDSTDIENLIEYQTYFSKLAAALHDYVESEGENAIVSWDKKEKDNPPMFRLHFNEKLTGWDVVSTQFHETAGVAERVLRTIFEAGLLLSPSQLGGWQNFYHKSISSEGQLSVDYVMAHREKTLLSTHSDIKPQLKKTNRSEKLAVKNTSKTLKNRHKI